MCKTVDQILYAIVTILTKIIVRSQLKLHDNGEDKKNI